MTKVVIHPTGNRRDFGYLFLGVGCFIASFFVLPRLPVSPTVAMVLFGVNLFGIGAGIMYRAHYAQCRNRQEAAAVGKVAIEVSDEERDIIEKLRIPCTLHRYSSWPKGASERIHRYWAEFPDDDAKVLFMMARPAPRKAVSFPNYARGLVGPNTRIIPMAVTAPAP